MLIEARKKELLVLHRVIQKKLFFTGISQWIAYSKTNNQRVDSESKFFAQAIFIDGFFFLL